MADKNIRDLTAASSLALTDLVVVDQGSDAVNATLTQMKSALGVNGKQDTLSNASTLAKITESAGAPLWDGSVWPGGSLPTTPAAETGYKLYPDPRPGGGLVWALRSDLWYTNTTYILGDFVAASTVNLNTTATRAALSGGLYGGCLSGHRVTTATSIECGVRSYWNASPLSGVRRLYAAAVRLSAVSNATDSYVLRVGGINVQSNVETNQGAYFRYSHDTNGGRWEAKSVSGSTTTVDTGVEFVANSWVYLIIDLYVSGNQVRFWINGTLVATITTNIASNTGVPICSAWQSRTAGTASINFDICGQAGYFLP